MGIDADGPTSDPLSQPSRLLALFSIPEQRWQPSELGDILAHQLNIPLAEMNIQNVDRATTLRRIFEDPNAPLELLQQLKRFFKTSSLATDGSLPVEVATVLYIAILVAGERGGHTISKLDEASLRQRIDWAARRPWLDPQLSKLFEERQSRAGS